MRKLLVGAVLAVASAGSWAYEYSYGFYADSVNFVSTSLKDDYSIIGNLSKIEGCGVFICGKLEFGNELDSRVHFADGTASKIVFNGINPTSFEGYANYYRESKVAYLDTALYQGTLYEIEFFSVTGSNFVLSYQKYFDSATRRIDLGSITAVGTIKFNPVFPTAQPIPEPSTYALLAIGLAGVGLVARRRQRIGTP